VHNVLIKQLRLAPNAGYPRQWYVFTKIRVTQEEKKLIYQEKDGQANAHEDLETLKLLFTMLLKMIIQGYSK
jgi:hypothetical protein